MKYDEVTKEAHQHEKVLRPMPGYIKATVQAVAAAPACADAIIGDHVSPTAACNRLAMACFMGFLEFHEMKGRKKFYRLSEYGASMPWARP